MKLKYLNILTILLALLIPILVFGIFNTKVSLKYETENPNDCISIISGKNLCKSIRNLKIYSGIDIIIVYALLMFRNKIKK